MSKEATIELSKEKYNADWLRSVTEEKAVKVLHFAAKKPKSQVINAWKQANGKTVRNHKSKDKKEKEK